MGRANARNWHGPLRALACAWLATLVGCTGCRGAEAAAEAQRHPGYWAGWGRSLPSSPSGNMVGLSCHNCYQAVRGAADNNLPATLQKIRNAVRDGADIVEIDVKQQDDRWHVGHNDDGSSDGPLLSDVLADQVFENRQAILYLELKEQKPTKAGIRRLLAELTRLGFGIEGRELVLRAFHERASSLVLAKRLLDSRAFRKYAGQVRLHELYTRRDVAGAEAATRLLADAVQAGIHGVEFHYRSRRIFELLNEARGLGLGTSVYGFRAKQVVEQCTRFRDSVDSLTIDTGAGACRAAVLAAK